MCDRRISGKRIGEDLVILKDTKDKPVIFMRSKPTPFFFAAIFPTGSKNPGSFLTAVLQGVKCVIGNDGGFGMIKDADNATIGFWLIERRLTVVMRIRWACQARNLIFAIPTL